MTTVLVADVGGRAGRWAARSLRRAGYRVVGTAGDLRSANAGGGLYCHAVRAVPAPTRDSEGFLAALFAAAADEGADVILPTDDEGGTHLLAGARDRTAAAIVGPDERQFGLLCDKAALVETAAAAGLEGPRSVLVDRAGTHGELPPLPCIVKPVAAGTGVGETNSDQKAVLAHDEREREARIQELLDTVGSALVQERVVGRAWRVHFVAGPGAFASLPVVTRRSFPRDAGMSTVQVVPAAAPSRLFADAETLVRSVGYVGPGSVQFIEQDGRLLVHDVNLRLPASVAISIAAGLDMPRLAVECALGRYDALDGVRIRRGVTYVWLGGEARALKAELRSPRRAPRALATFVATAGGAALGPRNVLDRIPARVRLQNLRARRS